MKLGALFYAGNGSNSRSVFYLVQAKTATEKIMEIRYY